MRSVGLDLAPFARQGLLLYHNVRPSFHGMEMHLALIHKLLREHRPQAIVIDPVTAFVGAGTAGEVKSMLMRLIDHLKAEGVTAVLTSLTGGESSEVTTETEISSLIDTWLLVRDVETDGERNRGLYVVKSRGMSHSNRIREFILSDEGVDLVPVHRDEAGGVLIGSARAISQAREDSRGTSRPTGTPVEGKRQS
jgi:circadian clock protein KaiC